MSFCARIGCVLVAAVLICGIRSQAQPFTNGSFEIVNGVTIASNASLSLDPGDTWLPGWSAAGPDGAVLVQNGDVGTQEGPVFFGLTPWDGRQWAVFPDDTNGGALSQTFQTSVNGYCAITFVASYAYAAENPVLGAEVQAADGTVLSNELCEIPYRNWTGYQLSFVATTTNSTITFYDATTEPAGAWIGLDAVTATPEPSGWPYIITQPQGLTNAGGSLATFTAAAGGNPSTVQWYLGTNAVPNATNTTLHVTASDATAGYYTAVFSNAAGTNVTIPAVLVVLEITTQPVSQTANAGSDVTFTASANLNPTKVQWYFGPTPILGAAGSNLTVQANNQAAGNYSVQFTYGPATVVSTPALLTVSNIPFNNGSFEETSLSIPPQGDAEAVAGSQWLIGWDISGCTNGVFVFNGDFFGLDPVDGNNWIIFDSEEAPPAAALAQTFTTIAGHSYAVKYSSVAIDFDSDFTKSLAASATDSDGTVLASTNIAPPTAWMTNQFTFTAQGINTTLAFTDTSTPALGPSVGLDNVTVADTGAPIVPPPALAALRSQTVPGAVVVTLNGVPGHSYVMETSTNFLVWTPVSTNLLATTPVNITNALLPGATRQFWTVVPLP